MFNFVAHGEVANASSKWRGTGFDLLESQAAKQGLATGEGGDLSYRADLPPIIVITHLLLDSITAQLPPSRLKRPH
jgi:hypothetical protein